MMRAGKDYGIKMLSEYEKKNVKRIGRKKLVVKRPKPSPTKVIRK
jgi:hypothetical protein